MYILIQFPEIQKYQKMKGFKYNSEFSTDVGGGAFVSLEWLREKLSEKDFNLLLNEHLLSYMDA